MQQLPPKFQSIFKINNVPIMPPVINKTLRDEIKQIREIVREKELKLQILKAEKDRKNIAMQNATDEDDGAARSRRNSYTLSSPTFTSDLLPKIVSESSESMETIVDGPLSIEIDENAADKSSKDLKNEIDKRSTPGSSLYESVIEPQVNTHLRELIERQKKEYLNAMESLKAKFSTEQQQLLANIESNLLVTSTPLNSSMAPSITTDDEGFTEFKSCLQDHLSQEEKTIVNEHDSEIKASTIINAFARGFLVRRLMRTIYVQEHIRNIKETLQFVLNLSHQDDLGKSPVQNVLLKAKLFRQLQTDLYNFNEIFSNYSTREQMKIIASDRDIRAKKEAGNLSLSFKEFV